MVAYERGSPFLEREPTPLFRVEVQALGAANLLHLLQHLIPKILDAQAFINRRHCYLARIYGRFIASAPALCRLSSIPWCPKLTPLRFTLTLATYPRPIR